MAFLISQHSYREGVKYLKEGEYNDLVYEIDSLVKEVKEEGGYVIFRIEEEAMVKQREDSGTTTYRIRSY